MSAIRLVVLVFVVSGCASTPPEDPDDVCEIFAEKPKWYRAVDASYKWWGIQPSTLMAVAHKESSYVPDARPPRRKFLWIFPGRRPSSAYGYAQATDETWDDYLRDRGRRFADRDDFDDAVDFIGWYLNRASRELSIPQTNVQHLYLAYHEGLSGYRRGTWKRNQWLRNAAARVSATAAIYEAQLRSCRSRLSKRRWWRR
ncbi:transglycosylase SLT domain-containing protein [Gammaproteobacteria bacterium]|nr:transglycosylase SLT domain-containing protein [Gammaproteobacteria bacterium]